MPFLLPFFVFSIFVIAVGLLVGVLTLRSTVPDDDSPLARTTPALRNAVVVGLVVALLVAFGVGACSFLP